MKRARGVAAITAILIVAVAASAAALMLSQQSAMVDQALMVASRAQADLYAQAGLDWARGVLAQDARDVDSPRDGWAQPVAALPVDRALVAGAIADEHGKLNLNNLVNGERRSDADVRAFRALLAHLGLDPDLADAVVDWIDRDADLSGPAGAEDPFYLALASPYRAANAPMAQVEELYRVRGFDAKAVARVRPHVTALPARTAVNVNTATEPVIAALLAAPVDRVAPLLAERRAKPFRSRAEFAAAAARHGLAATAVEHDVKASYFLAHVRVSQDEVHLASEALFRRDPESGTTAVVWRRPRY